jgi:hypothetical protein
VIEHHVVADLGSLTDHHAGAVVNKEALADLRTRVDLDTPGDEAREL